MVHADVRSCKWNMFVQLSRTGNGLCNVVSSDSCVAYDLYVVAIKYMYHSKGGYGHPSNPAGYAPVESSQYTFSHPIP